MAQFFYFYFSKKLLISNSTIPKISLPSLSGDYLLGWHRQWAVGWGISVSFILPLSIRMFCGIVKLIGLLRLGRCWVRDLEINSQTCSAEQVQQICTTLLGCVCMFEHVCNSYTCLSVYINTWLYISICVHLCVCVCVHAWVCVWNSYAYIKYSMLWDNIIIPQIH